MTDWPQIDGTADELMAEARRVTGIDIIDDEAAEPLAILLDSHNRSARFSPDGAVQKRAWFLRMLKNRLRMQRDLAAHPEILDIELLPPLLINAMPRTGSTKAQKMMAATGAFNSLPYWMCLNPASFTGRPDEDVSARIGEAEAYAEWFDAASPEARYGHHMSALEPEEEAYIMMQSLRSHALTGFAAAPDYADWVAGQDLELQYRYLNDTLKYLIWQGLADPEKPFLLKCVVNLGFEREIRAALRGVRIAVVHRDPVASVPSAARLGRAFRAAFSDEEVDLSSAPRRRARLMERHLGYRAEHSREEFLDIDYVRVRDDASGVAAEFCRFAGVEPTADVLAGVERWEHDNPKNKQGSWTYAAEDFGFTEADIRTEFAGYLSWITDNGIASWGS